MKVPSQKIEMHNLVLADLRVLRLRLQLSINDIDAVGCALKSGLISPEQALEAMHDMRLSEFYDAAQGPSGGATQRRRAA